MNPNLRNFALWVIIALMLLALFTLFQGPSQRAGSGGEISFSQLLTSVDQGQVRDVTVSGQDIQGHYNDGRTFTSFAPPDPMF
ncbi:MAG: ATP-dependent metallopeptidase FtsH/Yme1/Tma family protein, partial [Pseudomonadota bacterium]